MKVKKHLLLKTVLIFMCSILTPGYLLTRAGGMWLKPKASSSSQSIQHRFFKKSESKLSILPLLMTEWRKANVEAEFFRSIQRFFHNLFGFGRVENQDDSIKETITAIPKPPRKPKNAVLVFGSTGRTGQLIVQQLEQQGREVVVLGKDSEKLLSLYPDSAADHKNTNIFVTNKPVDVSDSSSLNSKIFEGVQQVVVALGPGFGGNGINNSTSYDVDYKGVENIVTVFQSQKEKTVRDPIVAPIVNFHEKGRNLTQWKRLDDVIMGGNSGSCWQEVAWNNEGSNYARWEGGVVTLGGGFCGTTYPLTSENNQHSQYDGILLKVRGDGNRYKFRLKPTSLANEYQYQAIFDPPANTWTEIKLPFSSFTAVKRNDVIYRAKPVAEHSTLENIGIIFSKFNFNERKNPSFQNIEPTTNPYPFQLDVESIQYYRDLRPEFLLISSAGAERINKLESLEETKRDIPIVQINPQGILNWKYKGEEAVRSSSLQYTIVRSTALANASFANTSDSLMSLAQKRRMEVSQGDQIAGRITREELADAVVQILNSPYTIGKTFEIRRDETVSGLLVDPSQGIINNFGHNTPNILQEKQDLNPLLKELIEDKDRGSVSARKFLPPFPYANEPFPTPLPTVASEEKKA